MTIMEINLPYMSTKLQNLRPIRVILTQLLQLRGLNPNLCNIPLINIHK